MTVVGIDLGTTNTVVAAARQGRAVALKDDAGRALLPSVVSFHPNGDVLVGGDAKERRTVDAKNTVFSVKRLIGRSWDNEQVQRARTRLPFVMKEGPGKSTLVEARGNSYTLAEISAFVLGRAKAIAEARLGEAVDECVITVPANFNDLQRAATKVAGRVAGLEVLRILNEPTAAALAYGFGKTGREKLAVYDFGGGTFDITLLDLSENVFEVLATAGDTFLGGDDVDRIIAERMAEALLAKHRVNAEEDPQLFERLRAAAEHLKIELSSEDIARVTLREVGHRAFGKPIDFEYLITRAELDSISRPLVEGTLNVCREALGVAGLATTNIDQLLLVGGSTRLPLVQRTAAEFWGRQPHGRINPDEVVALGAAIQAAALGSSKRRPTEIPRAPLPAAGSLRPGRRSELPSSSGTEGTPRKRLASIPPQTGLGSIRPRQPSIVPVTPGAGRTEHSLLSRLEARPSSSPELTPAGRSMPSTLWGMGKPADRRTMTGLGPGSQAQPGGAAGSVPIQPVLALEPTDLELDEVDVPDEDLFDTFDELDTPEDSADPAREGASRAAPPSQDAAHGPRRTADTVADLEEGDVEELSTARGLPPVPPRPPSSLHAPSRQPDGANFLPPDTQRSDSPHAGAQLGQLPPADPFEFPTAPFAPPASEDVGAFDVTTAVSSAPVATAAPAAPLLIDVTPLALGVEVVGGYCDTIIERNSPVPCERSRQFVTARDDQTTVRVRVSQGQNERFADNTVLGDLVLRGLRPAARGAVTIDVAFALDESGILSVSATDVETGAKTEAELKLLAIGESAATPHG